MNLLLFNFMQPALDWVAAILTVPVNVHGLAASSVLLKAIASPLTALFVAGNEHGGSCAWQRVGIHAGMIALLPISSETPLEPVNSFICNGR